MDFPQEQKPRVPGGAGGQSFATSWQGPRLSSGWRLMTASATSSGFPVVFEEQASHRNLVPHRQPRSARNVFKRGLGRRRDINLRDGWVG